MGTIAVEALWVAFVLVGGDSRFAVATDYEIYNDAAARWIDGGGFYLDEQLAGPYQIRIGSVLYPPVILWLLVPFVFLPAVFLVVGPGDPDIGCHLEAPSRDVGISHPVGSLSLATYPANSA